jgi:hypothetical protein
MNAIQFKAVKNPEPTTLLCHFSFWFGLVFATPLFIAAHNQGDIVITLPALAAWSAAACFGATLFSWKMAGLAGAQVQWWSSRVLLCLSLVMAVQGNFVHELFNYGAFNGERFDLRVYGWKFWLEWVSWLTAIAALLLYLKKNRPLPVWLPAVSIVSFLLLLLPALQTAHDRATLTDTDEAIDDSVFAFSSAGNLIHLLPDGFQSDVVRQVLQEHPELAAKFRGFTLFSDHVGPHQGTAPSLITMLTGEPFDLRAGFTYPVAGPFIRENSYTAQLVQAGYQVDYLPISGFICPDGANSCIARPFNDMKSRGLFRHTSQDITYSIRLLADLSLFRLTPMFLKEKLHNDGKWFFADTTLDGSSPWPDPVIRELAENLHVIDDRPVYKWHHFIGTHIPAKWNAECALLDEPSRERAAYVAQAYCVLSGIGRLIDRLVDAGIYDQTAFIISGDHGHNVAPNDLTRRPLNSALSPGLLATGRPALLVRQRGSQAPLAYSDAPTSMLDVFPTALKLAGLEAAQPSVFEIGLQQHRQRYYRIYPATDFYTGDPIRYVEYTIGHPATDGEQWELTDIRKNQPVPSGYDPVNRPNGKDYVFGASLHKSPGNNQSSWITGRQLAFVIELPEEPAQRSLALELHIPAWVGKQSFTVALNQGSEWHSPEMESTGGEWQEVVLPWPAEGQKPGRNFVSVIFENLGNPPDNTNWQASAKIRSIHVREHQ